MCIALSPLRHTFGLRDYGTAEWEGGEAGCDHVEQSTGMSEKNTLGPNKHLPSTNAGNIAKVMQYTTTCGKCGAIRVDQQMGLEPTPELFLANMVTLFREVRRVLRSDGVCFVNMGDSYASQGTRKHGGFNGEHDSEYGHRPGKKTQQRTKGNSGGYMDLTDTNLKPKDLIGMPWRLALALQQPHLQCNGCDNVAHKSAWGHFPNGRMICPACELSKGWAVAEQGWWLRSDIIWSKPNPMPESVTDRPTKAHEYVFLLTKSARYFYDAEAVREEGSDSPGALSWKRIRNPRKNFIKASAASLAIGGGAHAGALGDYGGPAGRNRRTVWSIATQAFSAAHFATFPTKLVEPMIKAGTSERGCCPECGAPWERVTEKRGYIKAGHGGGNEKQADLLGLSPTSSLKANGLKRNMVTTGWQPTCDCTRENYYFCPCTPVLAHIDDLEHGCPECGETMIPAPHSTIPCTVLDPFAGACTVGLVADRLGRDSIMIELNPEYAAMGEQRINDDAGWVADVEVTTNDAPVQLGLI